MRIGLIARCDSTGLGIQSKEFFDHVPCKALVIDFQAMAPNKQYAEILKPNLDWYPGQRFFKWGNVHNVSGDIPTGVIIEFLEGVDVVFAMETPYDYDIFRISRARGIKTVLQLNYEFLDFPSRRLVPPDLFAAPSLWNFDKIPDKKIFLPVPVNCDKAPISGVNKGRFLHIAGRPAHGDRNGTNLLLKALKYVKSEITMVIKSQRPISIPPLPKNITIEVDSSNKKNYFDNYITGGTLVLPRKYGGLCLPINEALACEMPVITTNISPNNLWLPNEWLVDCLHIGSFQCKKKIDIYEAKLLNLAEKIDQFNNHEFYLQAISKAREIKKTISWHTLKDLYIDKLNSL